MSRPSSRRVRVVEAGRFDIVHAVRTAIASLPLAAMFAGRALAVRYRQAALGILWLGLQPLFTMLVLAAVFGVIARLQSPGLPYAIYVLSGVVLWGYIARVSTDGVAVLTVNQMLVTKSAFPRVALPVSTGIECLTDLAVGLCLLLVLAPLFGASLSWTAPLAIPFVGLIVLFGIGIALATSALNVFYRDVRIVVTFGVQIGFFLTPVVWPVSVVPEAYAFAVWLNPLSASFEAVRAALFATAWPPTWALAWSLVGSLATLLVGLKIFGRLEGRFADSI